MTLGDQSYCSHKMVFADLTCYCTICPQIWKLKFRRPQPADEMRGITDLIPAYWDPEDPDFEYRPAPTYKKRWKKRR